MFSTCCNVEAASNWRLTRVDSSWTANQFAHTGVSLAGSALLAVEPCQRVDARPCLHPVDLLSDRGTAVENRSWWLAHTLPRQEKALAAALYSRDVGFYLPLVTRKSLSRGRTRVAQIALFPGYVFVCGNEDDRLSVLKTNRVLTVRSVPDDTRLRRDLLQFAEMIALGAPLLPEAKLTAGERVRVKSGPFRDQEGTVIRRNGKTRLLIAVDYLQQGASLEIDDCLLECV
jgi:transcriptional antiterminator NusG